MLTVFQNRRWDGDYLTLRRLLAEGALGRPTRLESRFERWRPRVAAGAWREGPDPRDAGGLLADLGSHMIDQAMQLFGPPVRVYAELDRRREGAQVDDDAFVALTHAGGERSHLWASMLGAADAPRFRAVGLEGTYESYGLDGQEAALAAGVRPGAPEWGRAPEESWGRLWDGEGSRAVPTEPGDYPAFYAGVARCPSRRRPAAGSTRATRSRCSRSSRRLGRTPPGAPGELVVGREPAALQAQRPLLGQHRPAGEHVGVAQVPDQVRAGAQARVVAGLGGGRGGRHPSNVAPNAAPRVTFGDRPPAGRSRGSPSGDRRDRSR